MEIWITIAVSVLGIASTLTAYFFNPKRKIYLELDNIYKSLDKLYGDRDKALAANDSEALTIADNNIITLSSRKQVLLKRL